MGESDGVTAAAEKVRIEERIFRQCSWLPTNDATAVAVAPSYLLVAALVAVFL